MQNISMAHLRYVFVTFTSLRSEASAYVSWHPVQVNVPRGEDGFIGMAFQKNAFDTAEQYVIVSMLEGVGAIWSSSTIPRLC